MGNAIERHTIYREITDRTIKDLDNEPLAIPLVRKNARQLRATDGAKKEDGQ